MLTVSVPAKKRVVPIYTLRHYTEIGLLEPKHDQHNCYKIYHEK